MKPVFLTALRTSDIDIGVLNASGAGLTDLPAYEQVADPGGVAGLDGEDRSGRAEHGVLVDPRRLALVGGDARVLEHLGGAQERAPLARSCP